MYNNVFKNYLIAWGVVGEQKKLKDIAHN